MTEGNGMFAQEQYDSNRKANEFLIPMGCT